MSDDDEVYEEIVGNLVHLRDEHCIHHAPSHSSEAMPVGEVAEDCDHLEYGSWGMDSMGHCGHSGSGVQVMAGSTMDRDASTYGVDSTWFLILISGGRRGVK